MSKSIYEVASRRIDNMFDIWDKGVHQDSIEIIEKALEQAQKQEKLLNQIKDIINRPYDIASMLEESKRYVEIENLIKEIENDK